MLNLIPKKVASKTLLFGKRPIQRIRVGKDKNVLELSLSDINSIYDDIDEATELHNKDYNPLKYSKYVKYKMSALNLIEAYKNEESKKTALTNVKWYAKIRDYFFINFSKNQIELKEKMVPKFFYPIEK
ncbi:conserved Plasmodium protein, unknown function [Plasmodium ovale wallikeri]|uniref:Uncharacterized protein n=2 Tax=Plasmodium ovale TaxID=36330 RepID=A0A1A8Z4U5_PLAOA|nr:conserved Plasmodium protein, unknown function [Plasmodium ovale wallikeri]SBT38878.1 conserved Plasmodium protein, unknown function [Plasmodium ovale wallikeri]SBT77722.1 conserved Plasmodium protein, unknown function [Plasmodium ovale]